MDVSIIVPVYNKGYAIEETIKSILEQTFDDFELLIVDDGSTDSSPQICDEYAKKDKRIRVIHKENSGVSSARNCGIYNAKGKYVVFCDADDKMPQSSIESLVKGMKEADMTVGGFKYVTIDKKANWLKTSIEFARTNIIVDMNKDRKSFSNIWLQNDMLSSCGKMYKKSIIIDNNIRFNTDLVVLEDFCFVLDYLYCVNRVLSIENIVYEYIRIINTGYHNRSKMDYVDDVITAYDNMQKFVKYCGIIDDSPFWDKFSYNLDAAYEYLWMIKSCTVRERMEKYRRIHEVLKYDAFQRLVRSNRNRYTFPRYVAMLHGSILGIILCGKAGL